MDEVVIVLGLSGSFSSEDIEFIPDMPDWIGHP
jgi:hypothetical protein